MSIVEDAVKDFVGSQFDEELEKIEELQDELRDLQSNVEGLHQKIDQLIAQKNERQRQKDGSDERDTSTKRVTPRTLTRLRDRLDLSQEQLADLLEVSAATVGNWERGDSRPQKHNREKIMELRETPEEELAELLDREDDTTQKRDAVRIMQYIRERFDLTRQELAELLDVSAVTIGNWERGETVPAQDKQEKILALKDRSKGQLREMLNQEEEDQQDVDIGSIREQLHLTRSEFANEVGVSVQQVYNWEFGDAQPESEHLERIQHLSDERTSGSAERESEVSVSRG